MKVWSWRQAILKSDQCSTTKLVLLSLSTYMNDHGAGCYPSIDQIARDTSLSARAVTTHISNAESAGFLVKRKRNLRGHEWAANEYFASTPSDLEPGSPHNEGVNVIHPSSQNHDLSTDRGETGSPLIGGEAGTSFQRGVNDVPTNSPMNSPSKDIYPEKSKKAKKYPQEFLQIWNIWPSPRRCEMPNAYTAWREAIAEIAPDDLLAAAQRYLETEEARGGFAPYPAKWLKRKRWLEQQHAAIVARPVMPDISSLGGDSPENQQFLTVLEKLKSAHSDGIFRSWLAPLRIHHKNCSALDLRMPSRFMAEWVTAHHQNDILEAVQQVWPEITTVRIDAAPRRE